MTAEVQTQPGNPSAGHTPGRPKRSRHRWIRRLTRAIGYLCATIVGLTGFLIALVGVSSGQRSGDPGDTWAGLIIGGIFTLFAVIWFVWLMGKKKRRH